MLIVDDSKKLTRQQVKAKKKGKDLDKRAAKSVFFHSSLLFRRSDIDGKYRKDELKTVIKLREQAH